MTDAFLEWKYGPTGDATPESANASATHGPSSGSISPSPSAQSRAQTPQHPEASETSSDPPGPFDDRPTPQEGTTGRDSPSPPTYQWELDTYDLFTLRRTLAVSRAPDSTSPALDFMRHGYITKTSKSPDVAVSITTLELLYRLRQRRASFSVEAFAKVVCDYYQVRLIITSLPKEL